MVAFDLDALPLMVDGPRVEIRGAEAGEDVEFLEISPTEGVKALHAHVSGCA